MSGGEVERGGLSTFRDHCREMANWQPPAPRKPHIKVGQWCLDMRAQIGAGDEWGPKHDQCTWDDCACSCHPKPEPPTGPTDAERELWARLADEIDEYQAGDERLGGDEDEGLFA